MADCLCRRALNMNKETTEKIESISDYFVTEMIRIIQKAIDKKVDELDAQFDTADRTAERRDEIRNVVSDMVNDGDITVSIDA